MGLFKFFKICYCDNNLFLVFVKFWIVVLVFGDVVWILVFICFVLLNCKIFIVLELIIVFGVIKLVIIIVLVIFNKLVFVLVF